MKYSLLYLVIILLTLISCHQKKSDKSILNKISKKYKYQKEIIRSHLGEYSYQDIGVYVSDKDTIPYYEIIYTNDIIDTSKSLFYDLVVEKNGNEYNGKLNYYYDSIKEGKLDYMNLNLVNKRNGITKFIEFENDKNNTLSFSYLNDNDTIMGVLFLRHFKDSIVNGAKKIRSRTFYMPIDNYIKTDNPFIGLKP